jgi:DNA-binding response OmpR family regulator
MREQLKGYRILIVEDEYFIGADLEKALKAAGAEVFGPLALAEEARSLIARHVVDAAVLDLKLLDGDGCVAADELARRKIPFVFATGYSADFIPARFRSVSRWQKPYDVEEAVSNLVQLVRPTRVKQ